MRDPIAKRLPWRAVFYVTCFGTCSSNKEKIENAMARKNPVERKIDDLAA